MTKISNQSFFVNSGKINPVLIQHKEIDGKGFFYIEEEGTNLAEMDYSISKPDTMVILHTEVDEILKGRNIGSQLLHHAAEYARVKNYRIIPLCPFVKAMFEKKPEEFADVRKS